MEDYTFIFSLEITNKVNKMVKALIFEITKCTGLGVSLFNMHSHKTVEIQDTSGIYYRIVGRD